MGDIGPVQGYFDVLNASDVLNTSEVLAQEEIAIDDATATWRSADAVAPIDATEVAG